MRRTNGSIENDDVKVDDNATNGKSCRGLLQYLHRVRYFFRGLCVKDVPEYATKLISAISMTAIHRSGFCRGEVLFDCTLLEEAGDVTAIASSGLKGKRSVTGADE